MQSYTIHTAQGSTAGICIFESCLLQCRDIVSEVSIELLFGNQQRSPGFPTEYREDARRNGDRHNAPPAMILLVTAAELFVSQEITGQEK
ncbi:MAG: hypothetical protein MZV63_21300 [Marinilabiliales bacterium]|nr:hypothetical protein [Marinilabiliales bacterium]